MLRFIVLIVFIIAGSPVVASERLLVFAAASQRDVLETLGAKYQENCKLSGDILLCLYCGPGTTN